MVPLFMRIAVVEAEGQMVLSELPWRSTERNETEGAIPQRAGTVQQGKGRENIKSFRIFIMYLERITLLI